MLEDALDIILNELLHSPDLLIFNGWQTNATLLPLRDHLILLKGCFFNSPSEAFIELWDKMPPGSFCALKECFDNKSLARFLGTSHAYSGAVWDVLAGIFSAKGGCKIQCLIKPIVLLRGGEKSWSSDAGRIDMYEVPKWFSLLMERDLYKKDVSYIRSIYIKQRVKLNRLLHMRTLGQLDKSLIDLLLLEYNEKQMDSIKKIADLPITYVKYIMTLPNWIRKLLLLFKVGFIK